jgi:hypothetical protein
MKLKHLYSLNEFKQFHQPDLEELESYERLYEALDFSNSTKFHESLTGRAINGIFSILAKNVNKGILIHLARKLENEYVAAIFRTLVEAGVTEDNLTKEYPEMIAEGDRLLKQAQEKEIREEKYRIDQTDKKHYFELSLAQYEAAIEAMPETTDKKEVDEVNQKIKQCEEKIEELKNTLKSGKAQVTAYEKSSNFEILKKKVDNTRLEDMNSTIYLMFRYFLRLLETTHNKMIQQKEELANIEIPNKEELLMELNGEISRSQELLDILKEKQESYQNLENFDSQKVSIDNITYSLRDILHNEELTKKIENSLTKKYGLERVKQILEGHVYLSSEELLLEKIGGRLRKVKSKVSDAMGRNLGDILGFDDKLRKNFGKLKVSTLNDQTVIDKFNSIPEAKKRASANVNKGKVVEIQLSANRILGVDTAEVKDGRHNFIVGDRAQKQLQTFWKKQIAKLRSKYENFFDWGAVDPYAIYNQDEKIKGEYKEISTPSQKEVTNLALGEEAKEKLTQLKTTRKNEGISAKTLGLIYAEHNGQYYGMVVEPLDLSSRTGTKNWWAYRVFYLFDIEKIIKGEAPFEEISKDDEENRKKIKQIILNRETIKQMPILKELQQKVFGVEDLNRQPVYLIKKYQIVSGGIENSDQKALLPIKVDKNTSQLIATKVDKDVKEVINNETFKKKAIAKIRVVSVYQISSNKIWEVQPDEENNATFTKIFKEYSSILQQYNGIQGK